KLTDDGQIVVKDYNLANFVLDLDVGEFTDAGNVHLANTAITLSVARLTATDLDGGVLSLSGGRLDVKGAISGTADVRSINVQLSGKRDALNGHGTANISKLSISGSTGLPVFEKCPGNNLNINIRGADATDVSGNVDVVEGRLNGTFNVST